MSMTSGNESFFSFWHSFFYLCACVLFIIKKKCKNKIVCSEFQQYMLLQLHAYYYFVEIFIFFASSTKFSCIKKVTFSFFLFPSFNRLDLPSYSSYHDLREKLIKAIEGTVGFAGVDQDHRTWNGNQHQDQEPFQDQNHLPRNGNQHQDQNHLPRNCNQQQEQKPFQDQDHLTTMT